MTNSGNISNSSIANFVSEINSMMFDDDDNIDKQFLLSELDKINYFTKGKSSIIFIVLYSLSIIIGLFVNSIVIITVIKFRHMRTVTNAFVINLTIFDLLVILVCMPSRILSEINTQWMFYAGSLLTCKLSSYIQDSAVCGSILTLTFISCTRIYAVHYPFKVKLFLTKFKLTIFIFIIWFIVLLFSTPSLLFKQLHETEIDLRLNDNNHNSPALFLTNLTTESSTIESKIIIKACIEDWKSHNRVYKKIYNLIFFIFFYFLPLIIIFGNYMKIVHQMFQWNIASKDEQLAAKSSIASAKISANLDTPTSNHANKITANLAFSNSNNIGASYMFGGAMCGVSNRRTTRKSTNMPTEDSCTIDDYTSLKGCKFFEPVNNNFNKKNATTKNSLIMIVNKNKKLNNKKNQTKNNNNKYYYCYNIKKNEKKSIALADNSNLKLSTTKSNETNKKFKLLKESISIDRSLKPPNQKFYKKLCATGSLFNLKNQNSIIINDRIKAKSPSVETVSSSYGNKINTAHKNSIKSSISSNSLDKNLYSNHFVNNWRKRFQQRRKICKMFILISALFGVSWLPFHIINLLIELELYNDNLTYLNVIYYYSLWFGHLNSIINPLCYALCCKKFKQCFRNKNNKKLIFC